MLKKFRWSKVYESSEEELIAFLHGRGKQAERITAEASDEALQQISTANTTTIWCAEGSLVVRQGSAAAPLQAGDAVTIDAGIPYNLAAGIAGYVCYVTN
jgi:hypothetical protein